MRLREETRLVLWVGAVFLVVAIIALSIENAVTKDRSHMGPAIEGGTRLA